MNRATAIFTFLCVLLVQLSLPAIASDKKSDEMSSLRREQALKILKDMHDKVEQQYYDPTLHEVDFEGRYKEAVQRINKAASFSDALGVVAWFLDVLNDTHTTFIPPPRPYIVTDGWEASFIGDNCFITAVKEGSDAQTKGVKRGDQVLAVEGFRPSRTTWSKMQYAFHTLSPRSGMKLALVSPGEQPREIMVMSQVRNLPKNYDFTSGSDIWDVIRQGEHDNERMRPRTMESGDVVVWKLPIFEVTDETIDGFLHKANNSKAVVIDLRGNPGGLEDNLSRLLGGFFDHEIIVGDRIQRKESKPFKVKSRGSHAFSGKLIVLVDSGSASSSEIFARVVQLEKRGTIIGDRSAGAVMEARVFPFEQGALLGTDLPYAVEVTVADLKMTDGKSLEHNGVVPDEVLLPSPEELAAGADPQLARALQLAGLNMSASAAGQLFPVRWK
jgi:carboxyl-terminal processing protease